jgi:hypothetical protein
MLVFQFHFEDDYLAIVQDYNFLFLGFNLKFLIVFIKVWDMNLLYFSLLYDWTVKNCSPVSI